MTKRILAAALLTLTGGTVTSLKAEQVLPTVPSLINNMQQLHPYVNVLTEKNNQLVYGLDSAQSEFDGRIEQDVSGRVAGYYDGSAAAQRFVKPLGDMNAKLAPASID